MCCCALHTARPRACAQAATKEPRACVCVHTCRCRRLNAVVAWRRQPSTRCQVRITDAVHSLVAARYTSFRRPPPPKMSSNWPLKTGSKVEIHGLKSKPQLNGKKGTIVGKMKDAQPAAKGRASTAVDAATSSPCATAKAAPASARDVASAPPKTAPIPAPADHSGGGGSSRWHVQVDFEGGTATCVTTCPVVAIKASNLTVLGNARGAKQQRSPSCCSVVGAAAPPVTAAGSAKPRTGTASGKSTPQKRPTQPPDRRTNRRARSSRAASSASTTKITLCRYRAGAAVAATQVRCPPPLTHASAKVDMCQHDLVRAFGHSCPCGAQAVHAFLSQQHACGVHM